MKLCNDDLGYTAAAAAGRGGGGVSDSVMTSRQLLVVVVVGAVTSSCVTSGLSDVVIVWRNVLLLANVVARYKERKCADKTGHFQR